MEDLQGRTSPAGAAEEGLTRAERLSYAQQREGIGAPGTQRQHKQYGDVFIDYWVLIFKIAWIGPMTVVTAARFMAELVRGHHVAVQQGEGAPPPGARRALKWPRLLTPAWLKSMHQSLLAQYKLDLAASGVDGPKSLDADPAYNNIHATAQALAKGQKGIHHTADPQASSALDKFSYDQYKQICTHLWKEICTSTTLNYMATNINTKFLMNFLWSVCGRSDHSLLITLACCCAPKCFDNAGPSEAWCYDFVVKCDKTHSSRELHIMQHVDVTMCPVYMLILYLVMTYTIQREPLPCPFKDFKSWLNTRIFTEVPLDGRKDPNAVYKDLKRAYLHQNRVVARVFQALGIFTSKGLIA